MQHIKGFDGLRAISILMVLFTHLAWDETLLPQTPFVQQRLLHLFNGFTGVNMFFVLSGFLITLILLNEKKKTGKINFKNFYARRFLRLLPPLLIFFPTVLLLMYFKQIPETYKGWCLAVCYLYNFAPNQYYSVEIGHTWSLALEEQFYLLWPTVIHFFKKHAIAIISFGLIIACFLARLYLPSFPHITANYKFERWFLPAVAPVIFGCLAALYYFHSSKKPSSILLILSFVILFTAPLYLSKNYWGALYFLQAPGVSCLLLYIAYNQKSLLTATLSIAPIAYIGKISYGIYVYQGLFLRTGAFNHGMWIQQYPQNLILTFIVAILSYHLIERKALQLKQKFR